MSFREAMREEQEHRSSPTPHKSNLSAMFQDPSLALALPPSSASHKQQQTPTMPRLPDNSTDNITNVAPSKTPEMALSIAHSRAHSGTYSGSGGSGGRSLSTSGPSVVSASNSSIASSSLALSVVPSISRAAPALPTTTLTQISSSDIISVNSMDRINHSIETFNKTHDRNQSGAHSGVHSGVHSGAHSVSHSGSHSASPSGSSDAHSASSSVSSSSSAIRDRQDTVTAAKQPDSYFLTTVRSLTGNLANGDAAQAALEELNSELDNSDDSDDSYDHTLYQAEKYLDTPYRYAAEKRNESFHAVFPNVPVSERLLDDFSCALSREILLQGRLYVSEHYVCFNSNLLGWVSSVIVSLDEVLKVDRRSTAGLFPNGIVVETKDSKHAFASFISRDQTLNFLTTVWEKSVALSRRNNEKARSTDTVESTMSGRSGSKLSEDDILTIDEGSDENDSDIEDTDAVTEGGDDGSTIRDGACSSHNHNNKYRIQGPLEHVTTDHVTDYKATGEVVALDEDFDAPLGYVYKALFGTDTTLHRQIMEKSDGFEFTDYGEFAASDDSEPGKQLRSFQYEKRLNYSIGPKSTTVLCTEYLEHLDLNDFVEVLSVTRTPNVPSGGAFDVRTRYVFTWGPANKTNLKVSYWVNWTGSSWIKGMIQSSTVAGQEKTVGDMKELLLEALPESRDVYSSDAGVKRKKSRRLRKQKSVEKPTESAAAAPVAKPAPVVQPVAAVVSSSTSGWSSGAVTAVVIGVLLLLVIQVLLLGYIYETSKVLNQVLETQNILLRVMMEQNNGGHGD